MKILVGIDRTSQSATALQKAASHAHRIPGATLHILNIVTPAVLGSAGFVGPMAISIARDDTSYRADEARKMLQDIAVQMKAIGVRCECLLREEMGMSVAEAIMTVAQEIHADVIVVGDKHQQSASRRLLGSTTTELLHHSKTNVLVARG